VAEIAIHSQGQGHQDSDEEQDYSETVGLMSGMHRRAVRPDPDRAPGVRGNTSNVVRDVARSKYN